MLLGRPATRPSPAADAGCDDSCESETEELMDILSDRHMCGQAEETGRRASRQTAQARRQQDLQQTGRQCGVSICLAELGSPRVTGIMSLCRAQCLEGSRADSGRQGRLCGQALHPDPCFSSSGPVLYLAMAPSPVLKEPGCGLQLWLPLP